jgi:hypothetical protein
MDLFTVYPQHQVLACKPYGHAIAPSCSASHIRTKHPDDACRDADLAYARPRKPAARHAMRLRAEYDILDPTMCSTSVPPPTEPPLPDLKLHRGTSTSTDVSRANHDSGYTRTRQRVNIHRGVLPAPFCPGLSKLFLHSSCCPRGPGYK